MVYSITLYSIKYPRIFYAEEITKAERSHILMKWTIHGRATVTQSRAGASNVRAMAERLSEQAERVKSPVWLPKLLSLPLTAAAAAAVQAGCSAETQTAQCQGQKLWKLWADGSGRGARRARPASTLRSRTRAAGRTRATRANLRARNMLLYTRFYISVRTVPHDSTCISFTSNLYMDTYDIWKY